KGDLHIRHFRHGPLRMPLSRRAVSDTPHDEAWFAGVCRARKMKNHKGGDMKLFNTLMVALGAALLASTATAQEFKFRFSADSATTNVKVQAFQKGRTWPKKSRTGASRFACIPALSFTTT